MAKYLFTGTYSPDGAAGLRAQGGSAREAAATKGVEDLGGKVEAFYYAFGDIDVMLIVDFPSNEAAAAFALQVSSSGTIGVETTVLLTPEEIDRAGKMDSSWTPPKA